MSASGRMNGSGEIVVRIEMLRPVAAIALALATAHAVADAGIDLAGSGSHEAYAFASGKATVDWQEVTVTPWWSNDDWLLQAGIPWLQRDATASGTINVHRWIGGHWVLVPIAVSGTQSDSGIGDSYLRAKRTWALREFITTYVTGEMKLPTGKPDPVTTSVVVGAGNYRTGRGSYSFGNDSMDFRLTPGVTVANNKVWATAEAGHIWSNAGDIPVQDRPMAYAGIGLTPFAWLEIAAEFDYEGEVIDGGDALEQWTYTLTLKPKHALAITLSTYDSNASTSPDSNWSIGVSVTL